jgi:hypothetical protein
MSDPTPQQLNQDPRLALRWYARFIRLLWRRLGRAELRFHNRMVRRYPTTTLVAETTLEFLYAIIASPISAVILALLLVPLVISDKVPVIVSFSIVGAWVVFVIAVARTPIVRKLTLPRRILVVIVGACIAFMASQFYKQWVLHSYYARQAHEPITPTPPVSTGSPDSGQTDTLLYQRLRELFDEQLRRTQNVARSPQSSLPCVPGRPRISTGPDGYKGVCDEDFGQWVIDEAYTIRDLGATCRENLLASGQNKGGFQMSPGIIRFRFSNDFKENYAAELKELRNEAMARLGPLGKHPEEQRHWERVFPAESSFLTELPPEARSQVAQSMSREIDCRSVEEYAPFLRTLGVKVKRRVIPRNPVEALPITEISVPTQNATFPIGMVASVPVMAPISTGFIIVEFNASPAMAGIECGGDNRVLISDDVWIDNESLSEYWGKLPYYAHLCEIWKPVTPGKPMRISTYSKTDIHVTKVTWFDD